MDAAAVEIALRGPAHAASSPIRQAGLMQAATQRKGGGVKQNPELAHIPQAGLNQKSERGKHPGEHKYHAHHEANPLSPARELPKKTLAVRANRNSSSVAISHHGCESESSPSRRARMAHPEGSVNMHNKHSFVCPGTVNHGEGPRPVPLHAHKRNTSTVHIADAHHADWTLTKHSVHSSIMEEIVNQHAGGVHVQMQAAGVGSGNLTEQLQRGRFSAGKGAALYETVLNVNADDRAMFAQFQIQQQSNQSHVYAANSAVQKELHALVRSSLGSKAGTGQQTVRDGTLWRGASDQWWGHTPSHRKGYVTPQHMGEHQQAATRTHRDVKHWGHTMQLEHTPSHEDGKLVRGHALDHNDAMSQERREARADREPMSELQAAIKARLAALTAGHALEGDAAGGAAAHVSDRLAQRKKPAPELHEVAGVNGGAGAAHGTLHPANRRVGGGHAEVGHHHALATRRRVVHNDGLPQNHYSGAVHEVLGTGADGLHPDHHAGIVRGYCVRLLCAATVRGYCARLLCAAVCTHVLRHHACAIVLARAHIARARSTRTGRPAACHSVFATFSLLPRTTRFSHSSQCSTRQQRVCAHARNCC
jgi:hypothetical protein